MVATMGCGPEDGGDPRCTAFPSFPDESCTGPIGALTLYTGSTEFHTEGEVIENVEIHTTSGLYITADNVTFRNVRILFTGAVNEGFTAVAVNGGANTTFENCEIDGQSRVARGIAGDPGPFTVRNCEIHHVGNGVEVDSPFTIEGNYLHDIVTPEGLDWHADGIQTPKSGQDMIIRHNTILLTGPETGAINIMGDETTPARNVLVEHNLMAGGGYTVYAGPGANYRVINNRFSTRTYPRVGTAGVWYWDPSEDGDVLRSGNEILETGVSANDNDW